MLEGGFTTSATTGEMTTGATWLAGKRETAGINLLNMFLGLKNASAVGETSVLALLLGGIYLCARRVIDFRLPLIILGSAAFFVLVFNKFDFRTVLPHLMSGGLVLGAFFMATDYSSSPDTFWGNMLYGFFIGFLVMIFRMFSNMPEGVSFAILIMNILTPLIDKYIVPAPFGRKRRAAGA